MSAEADARIFPIARTAFFLLLIALSRPASAGFWTVSTLAIHPAVGAESEPPLFHPLGVAVDITGDIYVADAGNHAIRRISPGGEMSTVAGMPGIAGAEDGVGSAARFDNPSAVAIDIDGTLYVADTGNNTIRRVTRDGMVSTLAGVAHEPGLVDGRGNAARFGFVNGIAMDPAGNVWVADTSNHAIRRVSRSGEVVTVAGDGTAGDRDGRANVARFFGPRGIALDGSGNVWIADTSNQTIRRLAPDGFVTTPFGSRRTRGSSDGNGNEALFNNPSGIAIRPDGLIIVSDSGSYVLRTIDQVGNVTTVAGLAGARGEADGVGSTARFTAPLCVAFDPTGRFLVSDILDGTIRIGRESLTVETSGSKRRIVRR